MKIEIKGVVITNEMNYDDEFKPHVKITHPNGSEIVFVTKESAENFLKSLAVVIEYQDWM